MDEVMVAEEAKENGSCWRVGAMAHLDATVASGQAENWDCFAIAEVVFQAAREAFAQDNSEVVAVVVAAAVDERNRDPRMEETPYREKKGIFLVECLTPKNTPPSVGAGIRRGGGRRGGPGGGWRMPREFVYKNRNVSH